MNYGMIEDWTNVIAFIVGMVLVTLAAFGLLGFFPRKAEREDTAAGWLILAIWLGFLGNGMNAFYWNVFYPLAGPFFQFDNQILGILGRMSDVLWKGMAALSVYLHMVARYKALPEGERPHWSPILMAFYHDRNHFLCRAYFALIRKNQ